MVNPEKSFNTNDYIEIFLRRIWYIIIPFVVIMAGAAIYAYYAPKEYRASTLILVTPQKVPEDFIRPTVTSNIADRLESINQEVLSRTSLERIISEFKLYEEERKSAPPEGIVELMRNNIQIEIKGKEGYFKIHYTGKDPKLVTMVTNKLASLFIEENLKVREQQAQGTSEFIAIEMNATKTKLEEQEKMLTGFKRQYMGELPEQREANLRVLEQLQMLYQRIGDNLRSSKDRKVIIQKQLSDTELLIASAFNKNEEEVTSSSSPLSLMPMDLSSKSGRRNDPQETQLGQLRSQLADLQSRYTAKHPDILNLKRKIADLEAKLDMERIERESEEKKESEKTQDSSSPANISKSTAVQKVKKLGEKPDFRLNPRYKDMEAQLVATELEIERLKEDETKVKAQMAQYRERVENTPAREQAMALLTRDYQNTKEAYHTLLKKSEEAQQAENLERRQKGEQFKVTDPARVPGAPFKPNIPKILLYGLLLGLGGGAGMAFFREQMDRSFRDAEDLETTLGLRVLANIPKIKTNTA